MDMDRHLYYVMSDKGILLNRVDFKDQVSEYGNPVQISPNGKTLFFKIKGYVQNSSPLLKYQRVSACEIN